MSHLPLVHNTFVIERHFARPSSTVFDAFSNPESKRLWFAEGDSHTVEQFDLDFQVGGTELLVYRLGEQTPFPGVAIETQSVFQEIVPGQAIVFSSAMSLGGKRISVALVTLEFAAVEAGTTLTVTHQAVFFEGSDGPVLREAGWNQQLDKLTATIETA
jgi:uncharacterized protein YndB with AHSA1/START domain